MNCQIFNEQDFICMLKENDFEAFKILYEKYAYVWSDPEVMKRLKENFVIVSLYVDVHNVDLQPSDQYFTKALNQQITTLGDKNADLQVSKYNANTQPYYFFLDENENRLELEGYGYDPNVVKFKDLLDDAVLKFEATIKGKK